MVCVCVVMCTFRRGCLFHRLPRSDSSDPVRLVSNINIFFPCFSFLLSFCLFVSTAPLPMRCHLPELLFMFLFLTRSCSKNNIWTNVNEIFWCWSKITEWKLLVVHYTIQHIPLPSCSLFWVYIHVRIRNRQVNMNLLTARLYESQRVIIPLNARALGDPNFTSLDWPIKCQVWLNTYWELRRLIMDHSIAGALLIIGRY